MYQVLIDMPDAGWILYSKNLTASEAASLARDLVELEYEVQLKLEGEEQDV
jgi:hypothetical protein